MGSLSNPATSGAGGPFGSAYTQTFATKARTQAEAELPTNISATLVAEIVTQLNATNKALNELKKLCNGIIDDLQEGKILS